MGKLLQRGAAALAALSLLCAAPGPALADSLTAAPDRAVTREGTVTDIPVLANDAGSDGSTLQVRSVTQPLNGSVVVNGDDTLRYRPHTGFAGVDEFSYTLADGWGGSATATVHVEVTDVPDPPVAVDQTVEGNEDTPLMFRLSVAGADPRGLAFRIVRPPTRGLLVGEPPELIYLPEPDYSGTDHFEFEVEDARGARDRAGVAIALMAVGDAPLAVDDVAETAEGQGINVVVLANDRDPDGDPLRVVAVRPSANASVAVNGDDTVRYQPREGFTGTDTIGYTIDDGADGRATARIRIRVKDVEHDPIAEDAALETDEDTPLAITLAARDADGERLEFRIDPPPAAGALSGRPPQVTYVPPVDYNGTDRFGFEVQDGRGGRARATVTVRVRPRGDVPVAADDEARTDESRVVDIAVLANDRDADGDRLRVVAVTPAANGSVLINGDDTVRYQPHGGFSGQDGFAYTIDDGRDGRATASVSVRVDEVQHAPVAGHGALKTDEDTPLAVALTASDADGDPLAFTIERPPAHGTLTGAPPDVSYLPDPHYHGLDRFVFAVDDGRGGRDRAAISITVNPVGDRPVALDDEGRTREGRNLDIAVLANDSDPDGDPIQVVGVSQGLHGSVFVNGDDTVRYQPQGEFSGVDSFTYTVDDGRDGTGTATVRVRVEPVADAPVAEPATLETHEDTPLAITVGGRDADGDRLAFRIVRPPAHGSLQGTPPHLLYVPAENYAGTDEFEFAVEDGNGGADTATVSLQVQPIGDSPEAVDDEAETREGRVIDVAVLANDADPDGDRLVVVSVSQAGGGSVFVNGDETVRYQPHAGFTGLDTFGYTIDDGRDGRASATVRVHVDEVQDPPVAESSTVETSEDTPAAITLSGNDPEGDPLAFRILRAPRNGSLGGSPPHVVYLPGPDYSGVDDFAFTVEDGRGGSDTGTVSITVHPAADVPAALDDVAETRQGMVVDIPVLDNDTDPDGNALRIVRVTQAANGSVVINGDDSVRYQANTGFTGLDRFAYTISDVDGETDTASVSVTVRDPSEP